MDMFIYSEGTHCEPAVKNSISDRLNIQKKEVLCQEKSPLTLPPMVESRRLSSRRRSEGVRANLKDFYALLLVSE